MSLIFIQNFQKAYALFSKSPSRSNYQKFYAKLKVITWSIGFSIPLFQKVLVGKCFLLLISTGKYNIWGKEKNETMVIAVDSFFSEGER